MSQMKNEISTEEPQIKPVVSYLKLPEGGDPYLEGLKCKACNTVYTNSRNHCPKCFARNSMEPFKLAHTGKIYAYTIIHRTFPGIEVPFISTIVDLDGGGVLKGNLINVDPKPENIPFGAKVNVVFGDALGRKNKKGDSFFSYFFELA
jgi:uncharacterized OB-fold protein